MRNLCNLFAQLFAESKAQNSELSVEFDAVLDFLGDLEQRLESPHRRIALVGRSNVGKSTLINALLGANVAPRRNGPYTAAVVEYQYSTKYEVLLQYPGEELISIVDCSAPEELMKFLEQHAAVTEDSHFTDTPYIIVKLPAELLKSGLSICDTPGIGATDGDDSDIGLHDEIVKDFLTSGKCEQFFWVFRENPRNEEIDFIKQQPERGYKRHSLLVNINDDWEELDKQKCRKKITNALTVFGERICFVDAKTALADTAAADKARDFLSRHASDIYNSSIDALAVYMRRFIVHCREVKNSRAAWRKTILARIEVEIKKFPNTGLIEIINELRNLGK